MLLVIEHWACEQTEVTAMICLSDLHKIAILSAIAGKVVTVETFRVYDYEYEI